MIQSIHFEVKKWDYNEKAPRTNTKTDSNLITHPLRKGDEMNAQGLCFLWYLIIAGEGLEILYYYSKEYFLIPDNKISDSELLEILKQSYNRSSKEVAFRNLTVGLDAGFPPFENHPIDLNVIKDVLKM